MVSEINRFNYKCPFCDNKLKSRFSKCFNLYCQGQEFNVGNLVLNRLNPELSLGRIIKKIEIPTSKTLNGEDKYFIKQYKVIFENNIVKILHPIDLIHYIFKINDKITTKNGVVVVNSNNFLIKDAKISYEVLLQNGKLSQIYEDEIISKYEPSINSLISKDKLDPPQNFLIKYWANLFYSYYTSYQIKCITNSRLSLMPHQISVAHRLSEEYFPRVTLADEVGLGKTIEAGIYIKEMIARNLADRVLIIVPASLVKQWQFEMQNKFNINFTIYDGKKVKELKKQGSHTKSEFYWNPFYYDNLIICSLQFARSQKYIEYLSQIAWDIVIFDEAHHLRRYLINAATGNYKETLNYQLAKNLSQNTESVLLLTATPLQLHSFELFSLISLIHPEAFENFSEFEHFRKNMVFINLLMTNISQIDKLNTFEVKNTINLLISLNYVDKNSKTERILEELKSERYKSNLLDKIEREHTLSNFLIRNRKKNVFSKDFLNKRIVTTITVNPSKEELGVYKEIRNYLAKIYINSISSGNAGLGFVITTLQKLLTSSKYAFLKSLERRLAQIDRLKNIDFELNNFKNEDPEYLELELENELIDSELSEPFNEELAFKDSQILDLVNQEKILKEFYKKLKSIPYDSKSDKLFELIDKILEKKSNDKVLIFTQFVDTLLFLKDKLVERNKNIFVDVFYGGLDKSKKDEVVKRFRSSDKSSILISTEIGGEGRNFQFCRILINYDLPWNPMKLEQRIGRLDRIGQESKEIYIYNLFLEGTIETDIVFALNKRINLFEESIGLLEPIIGNIEKDIKNLIFTDEKEKRRKLNEFNRNLDETLKKAKEIELQLDDLLIDKKSFQINGLITSMGVCEDVKLSHNELFLLINYFFDLSNNSYGILNVTKKGLKSIESQLDSIVEISLENRFSEGSSYNLNDKYVGTFDLELARDREDIDFFALGHPLINDILKYWKSRSFSGYFSILTINKQNLSDSLIKSIEKFSELYLFIFKIKFQGYIIEEQISAIITDKEGNDFKDLTNFVLNIENYDKIFNFNKSIQQEFELSSGFLNNLIQKAKKSVKTNITLWKIEIKTLNNKIYNLELTKKEKIYNFNRKSLQMKINSLKKKLETKNNQKPTEKQKENILKISDEAKRKERLEKFEKLNEQINILNKDIQKLEKKVDDLSFNHEDLKNELKKRNLNKYYTDLISFALIQFD